LCDESSIPPLATEKDNCVVANDCTTCVASNCVWCRNSNKCIDVTNIGDGTCAPEEVESDCEYGSNCHVVVFVVVIVVVEGANQFAETAAKSCRDCYVEGRGGMY